MGNPAGEKIRSTLSRWLHRVILLMAVGFLVLYMLILSPLGQDLLVRRASKMLQGALAGKVELKGARTDFWSHIELYGLSVIDTAGAGGMISVGHAQITYFLPALLRKRFVIRKIKLDRVVVDLQRARDGGFPLFRRQRKAPAVSKTDTSRVSRNPVRLTLKSVHIRDARLRYRDEGLLIDTGLADVEGEIRFVRLDSMAIRLKSGQGYVNTPWWNGLIDEVAVEGRLGRRGLWLKEASLSGPTVEIQGRGAIPFWVEGPWDLVAHARSAVSSITVLRRILPSLGSDGAVEAEAVWQGPLSRPVLKLNALGEGVEWGGIPLDSLVLEARYLSDQVLRGLLRLRGPVLKAEIREEAAVPNLLRLPHLGDYKLACRVDSLSYEWLRSRFRIPTKTRGGSLSGQGWAHGNGLRDWPEELRLMASLEGWKAPDSSSLPVLADLSLQNKNWRLQLFWAANALRGAGRLLGHGSVDGEIVADFGEVAVPARYFLDEAVGGHVVARVQVVGPLTRPALWFKTTGKRLSWRGLLVDSLSAMGNSRSSRLRISNSLALFRADLGQLGQKLGRTELEGQLQGVVRAHGVVPHLRASGQITGSKLGYGNWQCDSLAGTVAFSGDTLSWKQLWLQKDTSGVRSHGLLVFRERGLTAQSDFRFALLDSLQRLPGGAAHAEFAFAADSLYALLSGQSLDLEGLRAWLPFRAGLVGTGSVAAFVSGPPDNPSGVFGIAFRRTGWDRWRVSDVRAIATFQDSLLQGLGRITLGGDSSTVRFNVACPLLPSSGWALDTAATRIFFANVQGDSIRLTDVSPLLPKGLHLAGLARLRMALRRIGLSWVVSGKARLAGAALRLDRPNLRVGNIEADAEVAGELPLPAARVRLTAGKGSVADQGLDSLLIELALNSDDSLEVPRFTVWASGGNLTFRGGMPGVFSRKPLRFDGDLEMRGFPIGFANAYTGPVRILKGKLSGRLGLAVGPQGEFRNAGKVELRDGRLRIGQLQPDLTNLRLQLALNQDSVFVRSVGGNWGSGGFAGHGLLVVQDGGMAAADLSLTGKELSFSMPDVAEVRLSELQTNLASRPETGRFTLSGKVTLGESRFVRDLRLGDLVNALRGASARPRRTNAFLEKLDLDVALVVPQTLVVDVNLGKMRLDGHLALSQKAVQPAVTGEFRVVDGYIFYLDRKFEIEEATFRQLEPFRINPEINFRAVAEVRPVQATEGPDVYRVTLLLTGNLEHPELSLQSDPPLPQADIVSLLTIGRVRGSAGGVAGEEEMGISQILVQRAKSITSQQVTGLAARQMERLLKLESVTIEGNLFQTNQMWGPRVTITKRLAERLNLTYQTVVGHTNEQRIRISYRINPYLYLDGETDELGRAGIDLIARFRFK